MTVKELIDELSKAPPDAIVFFNDKEEGAMVLTGTYDTELYRYTCKNGYTTSTQFEFAISPDGTKAPKFKALQLIGS